MRNLMLDSIRALSSRPKEQHVTLDFGVSGGTPACIVLPIRKSVLSLA